MRAIVHCNPSIAWQVSYSKAFKAGLDSVGIFTTISSDKVSTSDITIILGPHWCKDLHPGRCIYIDRAYWGDPEAVSVHWIENGEKVYDWTPRSGRYHPELKQAKTGTRTIVLCDYGKNYEYKEASKRKHPTEERSSETLSECLGRHDIAVGGKSTALVDAAIQGLKVISLEPNSPVSPLSDQFNPDRESWVKALSWHNWTFNEIHDGELWDHFLK